MISFLIRINTRCSGSQNVLESSCTMQDYVDMQLQDCNVALANESRQILVQTIPFVVDAVTGELFWMQNRIVDWDSEVDLSRLFEQSRSRYRVKAAILHIHNEDSPVSATSGHYVTAIKQNNAWHLANDEFVRVVRMNECPLLPCGLLFEKCDHQCSQKTMLIEERMCEELSWEQCICKEAECVPSAASTQTMMPNETAESLSWTQPLFGGAVCAQAGETPDSNDSLLSGVSQTAESLSWTQPLVGGAVCTQERKGKKRNSSDGKGAQTLLKYFKTDRTQERNRDQQQVRTERKEESTERSQDRTERSQDRTERAQDRTAQKQDRTERAQDRTAQKQDRTGQKQDRTERAQDRTAQKQDRTGQKQDRTGQKQDRTGQKQDRTAQKQDRTERAQDRTGRAQDRTDEARAVRAKNIARERTQTCHVDPFMFPEYALLKKYNTAVGL